MTATIDINPDGTHDRDVPQPEANGGYDLPAQSAAGQPTEVRYGTWEGARRIERRSA
jgi:hypothetical protein